MSLHPGDMALWMKQFLLVNSEEAEDGKNHCSEVFCSSVLRSLLSLGSFTFCTVARGSFLLTYCLPFVFFLSVYTRLFLVRYLPSPFCLPIYSSVFPDTVSIFYFF